MTDQADTPDPIGECGDVPTRPDLWLPCDRERGHNGPHTWAMNPAYTPAVADEVRALRAENAELRAAYRDVENHWAARSGEASQYANALRKARTELAAARDREAALRSALERTQTNFIDAVRGNPVRGMTENLAENAAALGASVQSEQPQGKPPPCEGCGSTMSKPRGSVDLCDDCWASFSAWLKAKDAASEQPTKGATL